MTVTYQNGPAIGTVYGRKVGNTNFSYSVSMAGARNTFRWSKPRLYLFLGRQQPNRRGPLGDVPHDEHDVRRTEEFVRASMRNRIPAFAEDTPHKDLIACLYTATNGLIGDGKHYQ